MLKEWVQCDGKVRLYISIIACYHQIQKELHWFAHVLQRWVHRIIITSSPVTGKYIYICNIHSNASYCREISFQKESQYCQLLWGCMKLILNINSSFSFTCNYSILLLILKAIKLSHKVYGKINVHIIFIFFFPFWSSIENFSVQDYNCTVYGRVPSAICWA